MQHVIGLHGSDLRYSGERVSTVDSCAFQTVAVVDLPLPSLLVYVELRENHRERHLSIICICYVTVSLALATL